MIPREAGRCLGACFSSRADGHREGTDGPFAGLRQAQGARLWFSLLCGSLRTAGFARGPRGLGQGWLPCKGSVLAAPGKSFMFHN